MSELRNNNGIAFQQARQSSKQPEFKGKVMVDGKTYEIAVWRRDGSRGQFLTFAFTPENEAKPRENRKSKESISEEEISF